MANITPKVYMDSCCFIDLLKGEAVRHKAAAPRIHSKPLRASSHMNNREEAKRFNDVLKKMLNTPPQPKANKKQGKKKKPAKKTG